MTLSTAHAPQASSPTANWAAVAALTLCVATLIASEFMPVSLLTPIAAELHITEGHAGQAIAVSGLMAVITSLCISPATRTLDRKTVLLALSVLMIISGLMVSLAHNAEVFMAGRALIGVVIGGFWSMTAATVMRLVPADQAPRALGVLNGGNALATTIAAPLGSFLGHYIGWRGAFFAVVPLGALTLIWQVLALPSLPAMTKTRSGSVFRVLRRPGGPIGMAAVTLLFAGQFALFTYIRPFLETVTGVGISGLSLILLAMGAAGLPGTWLMGRLLRRRLHPLLVGPPLALALIAAGLIAVGDAPLPSALLLTLWGLVSTSAPVAWWTWLSKTLPDDAEAGGGLMVALIQMAITLGASVGGLLVDTSGYGAAFGTASLMLCLAGFLATVGARRAMA